MAPKTIVVANFFEAAPVAKYVQHLMRQKGENVSEVVAFGTDNPVTRGNEKLLEIGLRKKYGIETQWGEVKAVDLNSQKAVYDFFELVVRELQRRAENRDRIYLFPAAGRQVASATMYMAGQFFDLAGVGAVVPISKGGEGEKPSDELKDALKKSFSEDVYAKHEKEINALLFPSLRDYAVIEIPMIPHSIGTIEALYDMFVTQKPYTAIEGNKMIPKIKSVIASSSYISKCHVPVSILHQLESLGYLRVVGSQIVYNKTKTGEMLHSIIIPLLSSIKPDSLPPAVDR